MTRDLLLDAIGGVDESYIADAQILRDGKASFVHRRFPRKTMFLIAAIIISLLAFTVYAAESGRICNWALDYLCGTNQMLEDSYARTAEEVHQNVNQSVEANGCAITLQAAISDGKQAYLSFHIVLPEGMRSDSRHYSFKTEPIRNNSLNPDGEKIISTSYGWRTVQDDQPNDNEIDLILECFSNGDSFIIPRNGNTWSVKLHNLYTYGDNPADPWNQPMIAEGPWEFHFTFSSQYSQEPQELLQEPIHIWASKSVIINRFTFAYPVCATIESFQIRPMTANCIIKVPSFIPVGDFVIRPIYLVMKNGDMIQAHRRSCTNDSGTFDFFFTFSVPIDAGNIDYVLFPGGIRVPVSEAIQ